MIGIIYCNDLSRAPFIDKYTETLIKHNLDYRIILWNRTGKKKDYGDKFIVYEKASDVYGNRIKKILPYLGFSRFVSDSIKKYGFSRLIILTTFSALMIFPLLMGKYKNKFIFDFRDLTYERFFLFRKIVRMISDAASFTCISSPQFGEFINSKTVICHNFRYDDLKNEISYGKNRQSDRINLLHIGITRGNEYNKRLIELFGGDNRFEVTIAGAGNDTDDVIMSAKRFNNISIEGEYNYIQKLQFIEKCDVLLYYYPCSFNNNRALANKYYDGLIYRKPLIGNVNTYSGKRIEKKEVGISIEIDDDDVPSLIYEYFINMDDRAYEQNVKMELCCILQEDKKYLEMIEDFVVLDGTKGGS